MREGERKTGEWGEWRRDEREKDSLCIRIRLSNH